jgi:hypothetical protein
LRRCWKMRGRCQVDKYCFILESNFEHRLTRTPASTPLSGPGFAQEAEICHPGRGEQQVAVPAIQVELFSTMVQPRSRDRQEDRRNHSFQTCRLYGHLHRPSD